MKRVTYALGALLTNLQNFRKYITSFILKVKLFSFGIFSQHEILENLYQQTFATFFIDVHIKLEYSLRGGQ